MGWLFDSDWLVVMSSACVDLCGVFISMTSVSSVYHHGDYDIMMSSIVHLLMDSLMHTMSINTPLPVSFS